MPLCVLVYFELYKHFKKARDRTDTGGGCVCAECRQSRITTELLCDLLIIWILDSNFRRTELVSACAGERQRKPCAKEDESERVISSPGGAGETSRAFRRFPTQCRRSRRVIQLAHLDRIALLAECTSTNLESGARCSVVDGELRPSESLQRIRSGVFENRKYPFHGTSPKLHLSLLQPNLRLCRFRRVHRLSPDRCALSSV